MSESSIDIRALLGQILSGPEEALRAWRGGGIPVQLLRELYARHRSFEVDYFLAGYAETPSKILEELAGQTSSELILMLLTENSRTPKPILLQLAKHEKVSVRKAVAGSKWISPQSALALCEDEDPMVRAALAENNAITPRVQAKLSDDAVPFVRAALLKLNHLDEEIQKALCDDMDITVQTRALLSPKLTPECLLEWADSDESLSQRILLLRSQLPENVLESLLFSNDPEVQRMAISRKQLTPDEMVGFSRKGDERVRMKIAVAEVIPPLVQEVLAQDASTHVRQLLAGNACLDGNAAKILLEGQDDNDVLFALAGNEAVPFQLLKPCLLAGGDELMVQFAGRSRLSEEELDFILENGGDSALYSVSYLGIDCSGMSVAGARRLAHHRLPSVRALAATAKVLPLIFMSELSRDASPMVRLALAGNSEISRSLLEGLCADGDRRVQELARKALSALPELEPTGEEPTEDLTVSMEEEPLPPAPGKKPGLLKRLFGMSKNR